MEKNKQYESFQEIFDAVVEHARQMETRSKEKGEGGCKYRMNGNKCFVGCLIPDDVYQESMEYLNVHDVLADFPGFKSLFTKLTTVCGHSNLVNFLRNIQLIHDEGELCSIGSSDVIDRVLWEKRFASFSDKYNLKFNSPKEKTNDK